MKTGSSRAVPARRRWLAATLRSAVAVVGAPVILPGGLPGGLPAALGLGVPGLVWPGRAAHAHVDAGPVRPPVPVPPLDIRWQDGSRSTLASRLQGRVSAVQTMFTACSATCPLQGALFAAIEPLLEDDGGDRQPRFQLLSLSIDPMTDEPAVLAKWLAQFGAGPAWRAGSPAPDQVDVLFDFLRARSDRLDRHTGQVYLFNGRGELVLRTVDLPPPGQVASLMRQLRALETK